MLQFDEETTAQLELAYAGADVAARRRVSFDALRPAPGEAILDIGCGNGMLTAELARAVGSTGRVIGVDSSVDMLAAGRSRCAAFDHVDLIEGRSDALPLADASVDKAVAVQVFEYVAPLAPSMSELARVVRPGGSAVIADIHFDTWAWMSDDPARMRRMMDAWDLHLAERITPALLPGAFRAAGFGDIRIMPAITHDHLLRPDGLARAMMHLIRQFVVAGGHVPAAEADAWFAEQEALARQGRFFFSLTQFVVSARRGN